VRPEWLTLISLRRPGPDWRSIAAGLTSAAGRSAAAPVRPVPDQYAFQATDEETNEQIDRKRSLSLCGGVFGLTIRRRRLLSVKIMNLNMQLTKPLNSIFNQMLHALSET